MLFHSFRRGGGVNCRLWYRSFRAIEDETPLFHSTLMSLRTVLQGMKKVHKEKKEEAFNDNIYRDVAKIKHYEQRA